MSNKTINVGVIGTGGMGGRHVNNITREVAIANVVALMDVDEARLKEVAVACSASHTFTDAQPLIDHPDVEAVLIASPDRFHAGQALACIAAGKPVLCEKPLGTTAAKAFQVVEAEVAGGQRLVQLGFMREYDPAHTKVKQVMESGQLGKPIAFRGEHINPPLPQSRTLVDVITNSAVHDIHSARWLMGAEVERVYASYVPSKAASSKAPSSKVDEPETARLVFIQLHFQNGTIGHIDCNAEADYGYEVDVKMTGESGSVQTNSLQSALVSHQNQRGHWVEEDWLQRFDRAYIIEVREWVRSLQDGTPSGPSAWDGYVAMVVADAAVASAQSGEPVSVEIPKMPEIYRRWQ